MSRPYAAACENNQAPIFEVLRSAFAHAHHVLEIGSGTGQHSVYLAPRLPHVVWHTSELPPLHDGIAAWHAHQPAPNLRLPVALDLRSDAWPDVGGAVMDAVFTSNTLHIVAWPTVQRLFDLLGRHLPIGGLFAVYGPFNYGGDFTSESNRAFDAWLKSQDSARGIRDIEAVQALAAEQGLRLIEDHAMPANNRVLVFAKQSG
jgi:cyclopropane fatty-acyl-phospholipid synthase-like methyltransferase